MGMVMRHEAPLLKRLLSKLVVDVLPAALASVIGALIVSHYQLGRAIDWRPAAEQGVPVSAEMMQLVRDEHSMIVDFLKAQSAAEKNRLAAQDAAAEQALSEAKAAEIKAAEIRAAETKAAENKAAESKAAAAAAARRVAAAQPAKAPRSKTVQASTAEAAPAPHAPLVIAQMDEARDMRAADARGSGSLLTKTIDTTLEIKDHVVEATRRVVTAIGDIPSWIVTRMGGGTAAAPSADPAPPVSRLVSAS